MSFCWNRQKLSFICCLIVKIDFAPSQRSSPLPSVTALYEMLMDFRQHGFKISTDQYILENGYLHITYLMETRFCYEKKWGKKWISYIGWDNTSLLWALVLKADILIRKFSVQHLGSSYTWPTGSFMGKPRGNLSEMLHFVQTVVFSLLNPNHVEPHVLRGY